MTQLNKSAERAQAVLEKAKSVRNSLPQISVRQFVSTASKRNNPAAWLTEVEKQVKRMRSVLRIPVDQTADKPVHTPPSLIASCRCRHGYRQRTRARGFEGYREVVKNIFAFEGPPMNCSTCRWI